MKKQEIEPQIRWNKTRSPDNIDYDGVGLVRWFFLIVNYQREINAYTNRIYEEFAPIIEQIPFIEGQVSNSKLKYRLISFDSQKGEGDFNFYKGKAIKDERLCSRKTDFGLEKYILSTLCIGNGHMS